MDFLRQDSQHKTLIQQQFASAHCTQASSPLDENISAKLCDAKKFPYLLADYGMRQIAYEFSGVRRETKIIKIVAYPGGCSKIQLCLGQLLRNVTKPRHMPGGIKKLMCQIGRIFVFKPGKSLFYPFGYVEEERFALEQGSQESGTIYNLLGNCEMELQNAEQAYEYYEKGLAMEGNSEELIQEMKQGRIAACEELGDLESAKTLLAEYLEEYPDDEAAAKEAEFLETR